MDVKIHILLGCFGYEENSFIFCNGITNKILTISKDHDFYDEIMNFFDVAKLFEKPLYDYNSIRNFLARFRSKFESPLRPIWAEKQYNNYQKFVIDHRNCGVFIRLSTE